MSKISNVVRLYQAIYHRDPPPQTLLHLQTMEAIFGLQDDELLTQVVVCNLGIADQVEAVLKKRSVEEHAFIAALAEHREELGNLRYQLQRLVGQVTADVRRIPRRPEWSDHTSFGAIVAFDPSRPFPVLGYLRNAFRRCDGDTARDGLIWAARWSLFPIVLIIIFGMALLVAWKAIHG